MVELTSMALGGGIIRETSDTDSDSLSDYQEMFIYQTDWQSEDTDGDYMPDGWEVDYELGSFVR